MKEDKKPTIVVSRCLGFCNCRYNGDMISDKFVEKLKKYVNYITVCPEVDIGLETPRKPIRLILEKEKIELYEPHSGNVYTREMDEYSNEFFKSLEEVHGFILKGRSPSCGTKNVKLYLGKEKTIGSKKSIGLFASYAIKNYPYLPIEEEGRLTNHAIREHFLIKVYIFFKFKEVEKSNSIKELIKFHSNNKYLLMAYNRSQLKHLGQIVANDEKKHFNEIINDYEHHLGLAFSKIPRKGNYINTFMHIFGYFSDYLSKDEKEFVLDIFNKYKEDKIHMDVPLNILKTYAIKYNEEYLLNQTIWSSYPEELLDISDSGKEGI